MAKSSAYAAKAEVVVGLQSVVSVNSKDPKEKEQLEADLKKMGCVGLLDKPRKLKSIKMVQEFLHPQSSRWEGMIRRLLEKWTAEKWVKVYHFKKERRMVVVGTRIVEVFP